MIKVIIERVIADGLESQYDAALNNTIQGVVTAPGFISSEALKLNDNSHYRFVIINWNSIQSWQLWERSEQRKVLLAKLAPLLATDEKISVLEH